MKHIKKYIIILGLLSAGVQFSAVQIKKTLPVGAGASKGGDVVRQAALKVLGLPDDATDVQIKKAYQKLALQYHPDKLVNMSKDVQAAGSEKFKIYTLSYDILRGMSYNQTAVPALLKAAGMQDQIEQDTDELPEVPMLNWDNKSSDESLSDLNEKIMPISISKKGASSSTLVSEKIDTRSMVKEIYDITVMLNDIEKQLNK